MKVRFSLRTLLILATFIAVGIYLYQRGLLVYQTTRTLKSLGAKIVYEDSSIPAFHEFSRDFFRSPVEIDVSQSRISGGDLAQIDCMKKLRRITLDRQRILKTDIQALAKCDQLVWMSAVNCRMDSDIVEELLACRHLRYLDVHGCKLQGAEFGRLGEHPRLETLVFDASSQQEPELMLNGETIQQLAAIEQLRPVGAFSVVDATESDLCALLRSPDIRLRSLSLIGCEISPAVQHSLSNVFISELTLENCNLFTSKTRLFDAPLSPNTTITFDEESRYPALRIEEIGMCSDKPILSLMIDPSRYELIVGTRPESINLSWSSAMAAESIKIQIAGAQGPITLPLLEKLIEQGTCEFSVSQDSSASSWQYYDGNKADFETRQVDLPFSADTTGESIAQAVYSLIQFAKRKGHNFSIQLSTDHKVQALALGGGNYWMELNQADFEQIASLKELRTLALSFAGPIELEMVQPLKSLPHLVRFHCSELTPSAFQFIQSLTLENQSRRFQQIRQ